MKYFAQRVLRRQRVPIAYLYLLVRFLVFVNERTSSEPSSSRTTSGSSTQRRRRPTSTSHGPTSATVSRCFATSPGLASRVRTASQKLVSTLSPAEDPRDGKTGQPLYNHRAWLLQWEPDRPFVCHCADLPGDRTPAGHVAAPAASVLHTPLYDENMGDGRWLTKNQFRRHAVAPIRRWLQQWRQPDNSFLRWQVFTSHQWRIHRQQLQLRPDGRQLRELKALREQFDHVVISPIDHGPPLAYCFCPRQYIDILEKAFLDPAVFWRRQTTPLALAEYIQRAIHRHVPPRYHWALAPREPLPYAYVLPKQSKFFLKGRPIVSYSRTWCAQMAKFLSTAVLQILQTVVPAQFVSPIVHSIIQTFIQAFRNNPATVELQLLQQD